MLRLYFRFNRDLLKDFCRIAHECLLDYMRTTLALSYLTEKGLLPPDRAQMLRGWVHSGFSAHRSRQVLPNEREDMERLAQYIIQ